VLGATDKGGEVLQQETKEEREYFITSTTKAIRPQA
jgi:hypothetical protein